MHAATKRGLLGIGLALACACGGKVETVESDPFFDMPAAPPPFRAGATPPRRTPGAPQVPVPAQSSRPGMVPAMQPRAALPPASDEADPIYVGDTDEAAAANLLIAVCGGCHGSTAPVESSGGIRFIGNLEKLVAAGLIVPLSSATSRVVVVMVDGTMPPPSSGFFRPTDADIKIVANYIDNPRFFPGVTPPAPPPPAAADAGVGVPVDVPRDVGAEPPVGGGADAGADAG